MAAIVVPIAVHPRWTGAPRALLALPAPTTPTRPLPDSVYRRRQLVAAVLVVLAIAAVVAGARWSTGALGGVSLSTSGRERTSAGERPLERTGVQLNVRPISQSVYVVQPGDTVWAIAHRAQPGGDVRPVVDRLMAQLHGRVLTPGTRLALP